MKKIVLIAPLIFLSMLVSAQDSIAYQAFSKAMNVYQFGNKDSCLVMLQSVVDDERWKSTNAHRLSVFNSAIIYGEVGNEEQATIWYEKVINSDFDINEKSWQKTMPYRNYKHYAAVALHGKNKRKNNYEKALYWLREADQRYKYRGVSGKEPQVLYTKSNLLNWEAEVLIKLGKEEAAKQQLITELIHADSLENYFQKCRKKLYSLITIDTFRKQYKKAIKKIDLTKDDDQNYTSKMSLIGMEFDIYFSYEAIDVPYYLTRIQVDKDQEINRRFVVNYLKERPFYQLMKKRKN